MGSICITCATRLFNPCLPVCKSCYVNDRFLTSRFTPQIINVIKTNNRDLVCLYATLLYSYLNIIKIIVALFLLLQWRLVIQQISLHKSIKFGGSGGHSKCNCSHDRANFHQSRSWRIVWNFQHCRYVCKICESGDIVCVSVRIFIL